VEYPILLVLSC